MKVNMHFPLSQPMNGQKSGPFNSSIKQKGKTKGKAEEHFGGYGPTLHQALRAFLTFESGINITLAKA